MIVYKCILSGDELFTDAMKITEENGFYKIVGKYISLSNAFDESAIGANASAEEAVEGTVDTETKGIDVVVLNRLEAQQAFGEKKAYAKHFKDFVLSLKDKLKEDQPEKDLTEWQKSIQEAFKHACTFIKDADCFTGASGEGLVILCNWEVPEGQSDDVPVFYFYKDAIVTQKF